ncbi:MAG: 2-C-methyl-D-erythritol 4-phosphate cytidylyltransferase [Acidobacteria bacterium]|nr:2-C-methyl-D-erythritol 4-phosphate cytidylyltransferase [Acidobacteriota bacterium]
MNCTVVIPAAGRGVRFGGPVPKQYSLLRGEPLIARTIDRFLRSGLAGRIIVAVSEDDTRWPALAEQRRWEDVEWVTGGETRQASVMNAMRVVDPAVRLVAIHDAVRPFFRMSTLRTLLELAEEFGAAIPVIHVTETLHRVDGNEVESTLDRDSIVRAQTPQCFQTELLASVIERAWHEGNISTDEAALVASYGIKVRTVEGDEGNLKITTAADLEWAERNYEQWSRS